MTKLTPPNHDPLHDLMVLCDHLSTSAAINIQDWGPPTVRIEVPEDMREGNEPNDVAVAHVPAARTGESLLAAVESAVTEFARRIDDHIYDLEHDLEFYKEALRKAGDR